MRIATTTPSSPIVVPVPPNPTFHDAINQLEAARDLADSAATDPSSVDAGSLVSASRDASDAATLLNTMGRADAAALVLDASSDLDSAATALMTETPDVAAGVVQARGQDAEVALDSAFDLLGIAHD